VIRATFRLVLFGCGAIVAANAYGPLTYAQPPQGGNGGSPNGPPVYQRQGFDGSHRDRDRGRRRDDFRQSRPFEMPQVNSGWFQRPYPDHLDYFRLRSGPGNATYYGNGYGTRWMNGWGPGSGGWGVDGGGYPVQGPDGAVGNQGVSPATLMMNRPPQQSTSKDSSDQSSQQSTSGESLPAPK
jgi:hypothetical protein